MRHRPPSVVLILGTWPKATPEAATGPGWSVDDASSIFTPFPGSQQTPYFEILVMMKTFCSISNNHTRTRFSGVTKWGAVLGITATIQSGTAPEKLVKLSLFMIFAAVTSERAKVSLARHHSYSFFWGR